MKRRSSIAAVAMLASTAIFVSGCASATGEDELTVVNLAYSSVSALSAAPFVVATENGYFTSRGCRLGDAIEESIGGANTFRSVVDGGLDMGEVATNAIIEGALAGEPVTIVGSSHQYPYDVWYVVAKGSGIDELSALVGMKWGITGPSSAGEDIAYLMEEAAGIEPEDIELVTTNGLGGGLALLEGGDIASTLIIPIIYNADPERFDVAFEALDYIDTYQKSVYIASDEFIESNPDAIRCILGGIDEAMKFIVDDPEAAAEIYAEVNEDYTVEQLTDELELAVSSGALDGTVGFNVAGLEAVAHARELRIGDEQTFPWSDILDPSFLPAGVATDIPGDNS